MLTATALYPVQMYMQILLQMNYHSSHVIEVITQLKQYIGKLNIEMSKSNFI